MRDNVASILLGTLMLLAGTAACAMNAADAEHPQCKVTDAHKLPPESGGADALCAAIGHALGSGAKVDVQVVSKFMLRASVITPGGHKLSDQNFAVSDANLTPSSFRRFAAALAAAARQIDASGK